MKKMKYVLATFSCLLPMNLSVMAQSSSGGATEVSYTAVMPDAIAPDTSARLITADMGWLFLISMCLLILLILLKNKQEKQNDPE